MNGQTKGIGQQAFAGMEVVPTEPMGDFFAGQESILLKEGEQVEFHYKLPSALNAPVNKGEIIGTITYSVDGKIYRTKDIVITESIEEVDLRWCFEKVFDIFLNVCLQK